MAVTLVTGGAGYIGSHTCVELLDAGREVVIVDDLSNASPEAVRRIVELAERPLAERRRDAPGPTRAPRARALLDPEGEAVPLLSDGG